MLVYGLGASVIPVDHRASAFGVLHSDAQIGSAVSLMLSGVLSAVSLRLAFLGNAALLCGGTVVAWHWLGSRQADHHSAASPGLRGERVPRTIALPRSVHTRPGTRSCLGQEQASGLRPRWEDHTRRDAWLWKDLGVPTSVKDAVLCLTTARSRPVRESSAESCA
jgi:hypothetical protein